MSAMLVLHDECEQIVAKLIGKDGCQVVDYGISRFGDGYPGFLGDYFSLKIQYQDVSLI